MTNYPEITRRVALPRAERPDGWSVTTAYGALAWNAVRCAVSVPCPGRFSPIKGATQQSFSAVQTVWRRTQSGANSGLDTPRTAAETGRSGTGFGAPRGRASARFVSLPFRLPASGAGAGCFARLAPPCQPKHPFLPHARATEA